MPGDTWALCALIPACLLRLTHPYPAQEQSSLQFARAALLSPVPAFCMHSFLKALLPVGSNVFSHLSFKLSSDMPSSGKLPLILQNDLCYSHRTSHCMTTNQYITHLSLLLARGQEVHELSNCVPKLHSVPPLPSLLDVYLETSYLTFSSQGGVLLKCIDNESTHS